MNLLFTSKANSGYDKIDYYYITVDTYRKDFVILSNLSGVVTATKLRIFKDREEFSFNIDLLTSIDPIRIIDYDYRSLPPKARKEAYRKKEVAARALVSVIRMLLLFFEYYHRDDKYMVSMRKSSANTPSTGGHEIKQQIDNVEPTHIVFLDSLPTGHNPRSRKHSTVKAPHVRMGHYKTLMHPRYRYHPMYLVPNGVYVRPAFVGDRTKIVNGVVYTVLDV